MQLKSWIPRLLVLGIIVPLVSRVPESTYEPHDNAWYAKASPDDSNAAKAALLGCAVVVPSLGSSQSMSIVHQRQNDTETPALPDYETNDTFDAVFFTNSVISVKGWAAAPRSFLSKPQQLYRNNVNAFASRKRPSGQQ